MQPLVYLAVLREAGYLPAGAFYFPVHNSRGKRSGNYKLRGLLNTSGDLPAEMDTRLEPGYSSDSVPAKKNKNGSYDKRITACVTAEDLNLLIDYAIAAISKASGEIKGGFIQASPYERCGYCPYMAAFGCSDKIVRTAK